jgi:glycosyltransferase involved in cell wall biosynthesis
MPAHWFELLHGVDHLMVPCEWNRETFLAAGVATPISVVPHVRRHAVNEYTPAELDALRARLGVPAQHRVFYTIGEWRPRKALENLMRIYAQAFTGTDPVSLIIKTSRMAHTLQIGAEYVPTQQLFESTLAQLDRGGATLPHVVLWAGDEDGRLVEALHHIGHAFVSATCAEAWGLGAFDAVCFGKPVLMTGYGGQCEFLGVDWPGRLPHRLTACPVWPANQPSFWPSMRWAQVDVAAAVRVLRDYANHPRPYEEHARASDRSQQSLRRGARHAAHAVGLAWFVARGAGDIYA